MPKKIFLNKFNLKIIQLYSNGKPIRKVALYFKCSPFYVWRVCKQAGILRDRKQTAFKRIKQLSETKFIKVFSFKNELKTRKYK